MQKCGAFFIESNYSIFVEKNTMADYIIYNDCLAYVKSRVGLQAKLIAIEKIIEDNIVLIAEQTIAQAGGTNMYEIDDGQVRLKVIYKSVNEIIAVNHGLETMLQMYMQQLNGRRVVLRDASTFRGGYGFGWGGCGC